MEKFAEDTGNPSHGLVIRTDNRWKHFKYGQEVPKKVLQSQFDYLEDGENQDGFFQFHRTWYHTSEFMAMHGSGLEKEWDGAKNESMTQGVLLKISKDGEEYIVGTYYSASRDHWNELQAKKLHKNPEDHKHPFVVIEVDKKPVDVPIINPNDYDWTRELFLFSFGAYADDLMLVFANGVEKALEIAAEDLHTRSPGAFVDQAELKRLYTEALEEGLSEEKAQEQATVDLTYTEAGYIPSWEWYVNDAAPLLVKEAKAASKAFMEDPSEPFMRMNGSGMVALVNKSGTIKALYDDAVDAATDRGGSDLVVWLAHRHAVGDRIEFDGDYNEIPEEDDQLRPNPRQMPPYSNGYPRDLNQLTREQHAAIVQSLARLPLSELRRRQDLNTKQIKQAHEQGNEAALMNLQVREAHYQAAIDTKEFNSNPGALRRQNSQYLAEWRDGGYWIIFQKHGKHLFVWASSSAPQNATLDEIIDRVDKS